MEISYYCLECSYHGQCLRQNGPLREGISSLFQAIFASIDKVLVLGGKLGTRL